MRGMKLEFCILTSLLIMTRFWDITSTYIISPNLEKETNPIVSIFGQGWVSIIIIQIILISVIIIFNYYSLFKINIIHPSNKGYKFIDFLTYFYFGEKQNPIKLLYKLPKNKIILVNMLGYVLPRTLIVVSVVISLSSTFLIFSSSYAKFYSVARPYYYIVLVLIALFFYILFFRREYNIYQKT